MHDITASSVDCGCDHPGIGGSGIGMNDVCNDGDGLSAQRIGHRRTNRPVPRRERRALPMRLAIFSPPPMQFFLMDPQTAATCRIVLSPRSDSLTASALNSRVNRRRFSLISLDMVTYLLVHQMGYVPKLICQAQRSEFVQNNEINCETVQVTPMLLRFIYIDLANKYADATKPITTTKMRKYCCGTRLA